MTDLASELRSLYAQARDADDSVEMTEVASAIHDLRAGDKDAVLKFLTERGIPA